MRTVRMSYPLPCFSCGSVPRLSLPDTCSLFASVDDDDSSPKTPRMLFKLMERASGLVILYLGMFGLSTTFRSQRTRGKFCHRTRGDGP